MTDDELREIQERHKWEESRNACVGNLSLAIPGVHVSHPETSDLMKLLAYVDELRASLDAAYQCGAHTDGTAALCRVMGLKEGRHTPDSVQRLAAERLATAGRVVEAARHGHDGEQYEDDCRICKAMKAYDAELGQP